MDGLGFVSLVFAAQAIEPHYWLKSAES